jgi:hypothetical protein
MRFEAQHYKPVGTESEDMRKFLNHYGLVTKFLLQFNTEKFKLIDDVKMDSFKVQVVHNQKSAIFHKQGLTSNIVLQGRVEMFSVSRVENNKLTVTPKLLTTSIVNPTFSRLTQKIQVEDPTLFQVGDKILIGSSYRTIGNITGNEFTLDENVMYANVYVVSLATETLQAYVF